MSVSHILSENFDSLSHTQHDRRMQLSERFVCSSHWNFELTLSSLFLSSLSLSAQQTTAGRYEQFIYTHFALLLAFCHAEASQIIPSLPDKPILSGAESTGGSERRMGESEKEWATDDGSERRRRRTEPVATSAVLISQSLSPAKQVFMHTMCLPCITCTHPH